jgi:hypothetical protein
MGRGEVVDLRYMNCPVCGSRQTWKTVRFNREFPCTSCEAGLRIPESYSNLGVAASTVVSLALVFGFGVRGVRLLVVAVVIWFPVSIVVGSVIRHIWPPVLEEASETDLPGRMPRSG